MQMEPQWILPLASFSSSDLDPPSFNTERHYVLTQYLLYTEQPFCEQ